MPDSTASTFLARLETDSSLLEKLKTAAPKSRTELTAAILALAAREGVTLTTPDVKAHLASLDSPTGELSDAQLNAVSGGYVAFMNEVAPW